MEEKLRIGIITHHYIKNYGAFLQAYALQEALLSILPGIEVEIINYVNKKHYFKNLRPFLISRPRSKNCIRALRLFVDEKKKLRQYYMAYRKLNISLKCRNARAINKMKYDTIIIGSDEVWNFNTVGVDPIKFTIGLKCNNIIAYAPSVGSVGGRHKLPDYIPKGIENFKMISVRDDQTKNFVKNIYKGNIVKVLDPTLLYDFDEELSKINIKDLTAYILIYQCELDQIQKKLIKEFARINNLIIIGAGYHEDWFDKSLIDISPFEWAQLFYEAKYVITGTFHGTIFAIKSKAKFVAYPTLPNRVEKVDSLLRQFGLRSQIVNQENKDEICNKIINDIDYDTVYQEIDILRQKSIDFLTKSVCKKG